MNGVLRCVASFLLLFACCVEASPAPTSDAAQCSLTIWSQNTFDNVTKTKINVREGDTVSLSCEYRCPGAEENPPPIEWLGPRYTRIRSEKGRIYVDPGVSPWIKLLHVQSASADNIGVYTCHVRGSQSVHVDLDLEVQAEEFTNLDLTRGEARPFGDRFYK
ncbi:uncharacterized protein LOC132562418 isoform X2 [Ylistrum balloti]|uniref:uncharacterized protein LOC132562418 isoform X2 n=1 Tax=Ylistrum balloti TaxID=509963 RepID=UPI002905B305|nr:uncharacterized protein LOC132562418 isoform X2 [Ylistrum balloti]